MGFSEINKPSDIHSNHAAPKRIDLLRLIAEGKRTALQEENEIVVGENGKPLAKLQLASECTPEHPILPGGMKGINKLWRNVSGRESENKLHRQADLHYARGEYGEAERLYKDVLADYERKPKLDSLEMAMARNGLANICYEQKKYKDAEDLYNSVLPIYEQKLGPDEYRTEGVRRKLADIAEKLEHFGNYRRGEHLGQGGFANVYRGEHKHLPDQQVAIKKLHTCLVNPENIEEFRKEAKILAKLDHPNIMCIKDYGVKNGFPYLVLEYAPHGTLRSKHPDDRPLPPTQIAAYVNQIADALDYLHNTKVKIKDEDEEKPLMHLDLKPENLLLGAKGQILLSDFGLAQTIERTTAQLTQEKIAGTLAYMAPEQIAGKPRPASDQYALGIMVYEWLSGKRPFQGKRQGEIIAQHLNDDPPPLRGKITGISREMKKNIEQVVFKALEKDPKDRFDSVKDFAEAFKRACGDCSPSAERGKQALQDQARNIKQEKPDLQRERKELQNIDQKKKIENLIKDHYESGEKHRQAGRYKEALNDFNKVIELDKNNVLALESRGETYRLLKQYDKALPDLDEAIKLNPKRAWALARRGETYRLLKQYDKALPDLDEAIKLNPKDVWAIGTRGQVYQAKGKNKEALADFESALALNNSLDWVKTARDEVLQKMDQGNKGKEKEGDKKLQKGEAGSPSTGRDEEIARRVEREVLDHVEKSGTRWLESEAGKKYIKENAKYVVSMLANEQIDKYLRQDISDALIVLGEKSVVKDLIKILPNTQINYHVHQKIRHAIVKLGGKSVTKDLVLLLTDEHIYNRRPIVWVIEELGDKSVIKDLALLFTNTQFKGDVRWSMAQSIRALGGQLVAKDLVPLLTDEQITSFDREDIVGLIGKLGDKTIIPALDKIRSDGAIHRLVRARTEAAIMVLRNKA